MSRSESKTDRLAQELDRQGVRVLATGPGAIRAVTNLMVSKADIPVALEIFATILRR